jgi:ketosteroid isomerase-like protein
MKYLALFLVALLTACGHITHNRVSKNEIVAVLMQQQEFWNNGDIKGYMKGYYKSDSLRFVSGGKVTYGWQTTLDRYLKSYPDKSAMGRLVFSEIDVKPLSEESALVFGKWELQRKSDHPWGLFTLIFKKTGCGWRIIHDHTSIAR